MRPHKQFTHVSSGKLMGLLKQKILMTMFWITLSLCIVTFPLVFNETIAMDVKHWSDDRKTWFLCITDNVTSYNALCVVK